MKWSLFVIFVLLISGCLENSQLDPSSWLKANGEDPVDYVISCFRNHDIVFLGEDHYVKHDLLFVQSLIPELYENGIYLLGMEFLDAEDQAKIDRLLTAPEYNESLAVSILRHHNSSWSYQEYLDILYTAWEVNSAHPAGHEFRIIGLNHHYDLRKLYYGTEEERKAENEKTARGDRYMAEVIKKEILPQKALIYCGSHHAFTRYQMRVEALPDTPFYKKAKKWCDEDIYGQINETIFYKKRTGNYIYEEIGDRAMTLRLHGTWFPLDFSLDIPRYIPPAKGVIDRAAMELGKPVAFDIQRSPFASIGDPECYYATGYPDGFTLSQLYDGYIVLSPITEFEPVTLVPAEKWIDTPEALEEIRYSQDNPELTREEFMEFQRRDLIKTFASYARPAYIIRTGREPADIYSVVESSETLTFITPSIIPPSLRNAIREFVKHFESRGKRVVVTSDLKESEGTPWIIGTPGSNPFLQQIENPPFRITKEGIFLEGDFYEGDRLVLTTLLPGDDGWIIITTGHRDEDLARGAEWPSFAWVIHDRVGVIGEGFYKNG